VSPEWTGLGGSPRTPLARRWARAQAREPRKSRRDAVLCLLGGPRRNDEPRKREQNDPKSVRAKDFISSHIFRWDFLKLGPEIMLKGMTIACRGFAAIIACSLLLLSCRSAEAVRPLGDGFGLIRHGNAVPHSAYIISLVRRDEKGKWLTVWHAISFRCQGPVTGDDSILFGGITNMMQAELGHVRLLFSSGPTGVVDVTDALADEAGIKGPITVRFIKLKRAGAKLHLDVDGEKQFVTQSSFEHIALVAKSITQRNNTRIFDGIKIYE
jgi:hypothetical protein